MTSYFTNGTRPALHFWHQASENLHFIPKKTPSTSARRSLDQEIIGVHPRTVNRWQRKQRKTKNDLGTGCWEDFRGVCGGGMMGRWLRCGTWRTTVYHPGPAPNGGGGLSCLCCCQPTTVYFWLCSKFHVESIPDVHLKYCILKHVMFFVDPINTHVREKQGSLIWLSISRTCSGIKKKSFQCRASQTDDRISRCSRSGHFEVFFSLHLRQHVDFTTCKMNELFITDYVIIRLKHTQNSSLI